MKSLKRKISIRGFLQAIYLPLVVLRAVAGQAACFPEQALPQLFHDANDAYPSFVFSTLASESDLSVFVAGRQESSLGDRAYIMKVNYAVDRTQWRRYFTTAGMDTITAMALSPDN